MKTTTEFESTISIPIDHRKYEEEAKGDVVDVIFLFDNGTRLSQRRMERKSTISTKRVLGFFDGHIYPILRTVANEELIDVDEFARVCRATHRVVRKLENGIRVSYNKEECEKGERYSVEYEIEYDESTAYDEIIKLEKELMRVAHIDGHFDITMSMSLENIFACVMTKVQMWHYFDDSKPYLWAYKWNGVKAKLMIDQNGSTAYLWPDAGNISAVPFRGYHPFLKNLCLVVELMDDRVVVLEIIGSRFSDNQIYVTEPIINVEILNYLHELMFPPVAAASSASSSGSANANNNIMSSTMFIDNKPLIVQKFYAAPKPDNYDARLHDGIIIVQNDSIIKWKVPTIDVKCIGPYTFAVANKTFKLSEHGIKDAIYEISPMYKIIRRRTDRIACSTEQEFKVFTESVKLLLNK